MALIQSTISVSNQATKVVSVTETTGAYTPTNLGGYGATQSPSGTRETTDVYSSNLYLLKLCGTLSFNGGADPTVTHDIYSTSFDTATAQTIANGSPILIDLISETNYIDGVYKAIYYNWFSGADVVTQGSAANLITVPDSTEFTNAAYINIGIDSVSYIYEILEIVDGTTIKINGETALVSDTPYTVGYSSTSYFYNVHDINICLHADIAKVACSDCGCNKSKVEKLYTAVMDFFGIQPNMDRGSYSCAQEIINSITIYCAKSGCGC